MVRNAGLHRQSPKKHFFWRWFCDGRNGVQIINEHQLPYAPNKLFLIFPEDLHSFEVQSLSQFFFIRFNNDYLKTQNSQNIRELEYIFNSHNHLPGCILKTVTDKPLYVLL
jgi:hypothetical protein